MWALHKLRKIMAANFGSLINITALLSSPTADSPEQEVARPFPLVSGGNERHGFFLVLTMVLT